MGDNRRDLPIILLLAVLSASVYAGLAGAGDLRSRIAPFLLGHAALVGLMLLAWSRARRRAATAPIVLGAALIFRLIAAAGPPALSDDVYRYVWDGRVQLHGVHPYRFAPTATELTDLRDDDWAKINHPELKTIYPPLAELLFAGLAATGGGPSLFKLAMGLIDFGVVLALCRLLRLLALPWDRVILYAWNPLAVLETAGSGHVEPLGVLLLLLAGSWIIDRRPGLSTLALAASVQVKLLPVALIPDHARRSGLRWLPLLGLALLAPLVPYAWSGPLVGAGLFDYAGRWQHNAFVFSGVEGLFEWIDTARLLKPAIAGWQQRMHADWIPWDLLYRHVWPASLARLAVACAALVWVAWLGFRRHPSVARTNLLGLGGILLLVPTVHPWYLLWVLPWAAALLSPGWLALAVAVPLAYTGASGEVPLLVRWLEYGPALALMVWSAWRGRRTNAPGPPSAAPRPLG